MTKWSFGMVSVDNRNVPPTGPIGRVPEEMDTAGARRDPGPANGGVRTDTATSTNNHERSGSTRRRVIEAGARVFADLGFHAATKERIGAAAGFSHQTVRDYFRTKEGLLTAIVADAWKSITDAMAQRPGASAADQLMSAYDALDTLVRARPAEARCVLHEAQIAGPKGGPLVIEEERAFKRAVEQLLGTSGAARGGAATARADVVIAAMQALARPSVVVSESEPRARYTAEEARQSFRALTAAMLSSAS